jgi:membrane protein
MQPRLFVFQPTAVARFWGLLQRAFMAAYEDNVFGISKGIAYSALLSFVPVFTSLTAILAQAQADGLARVIARFLFEVVPPGSEDLVKSVFIVKQRPGWLLVSATLLSVWAASGAMASLMEGFQAAYRLPTGRPFLKQRSVAILLVFCTALPGLAASALVLFGNRIEHTFISDLAREGEDLKGWVILLGRSIRIGASLLTIITVTALAYYLGPNRPMKFLRVWPGAMVATVMWLFATLGFAWYGRNITNYNVLYGSIGAFIALLTWLYLISVIALVGCEFNAERDRASMERLET